MSNIAVRLPSSLFRAVPPDLVTRTYCSSAVEEAHEDRAVTGQRTIARTTARRRISRSIRTCKASCLQLKRGCAIWAFGASLSAVSGSRRRAGGLREISRKPKLGSWRLRPPPHA